ncbi:MAG TPA: MIP family channel protein [Dehalococcoidia bacterium]|nr:MIP family channel protein [Dehalococcoidia bacterium]
MRQTTELIEIRVTPLRVPDLAASLVAEFLGPFTFIFAGIAATAVANEGAGNLITIGLAYGLAIGLMVAAMGHISGAHFNPAVTIGMFLAGKIDLVKGVLYIVAQLAGTAAAAGLLKYILNDLPFDAVKAGVPALSGAVDEGQGLLLEIIMTFFLVMVIFGTAVDPRAGHRAVAGLAIGLAVTMDTFLGGPLTGAAMNPARSFGPAAVANEWADAWIYWVGPIVGAALAALLFSTVLMSAEEEAVPFEQPV